MFCCCQVLFVCLLDWSPDLQGYHGFVQLLDYWTFQVSLDWSFVVFCWVAVDYCSVVDCWFYNSWNLVLYGLGPYTANIHSIASLSVDTELREENESKLIISNIIYNTYY